MPEKSGLADSAQHWRCVRRHLNAHRYELAARAAELYPKDLRVGSTRLLAQPDWVPSQPLELDQIRLDWTGHAPPGADVTGPLTGHLRPLRPDGRRYAGYAEALAGIERPTLLENRPIYRLLSASLDTTWPCLELTGSRYFDWVDGGEAIAHELAAAPAGDADLPGRLRLRHALGSPTGLAGRTALSAVTTLALRVPAAGDPTFVLHWRDPAAVTHAGGLYQVMPVGVFQTAVETEQAQARDLDLWRCMAREFREEFLGADDALDALFGGLVSNNAEGRVIAGIPFTAGTVDRFTRDEPMQAAGTAVLELAWQHRKHLLG